MQNRDNMKGQGGSYLMELQQGRAASSSSQRRAQGFNQSTKNVQALAFPNASKIFIEVIQFCQKYIDTDKKQLEMLTAEQQELQDKQTNIYVNLKDLQEQNSKNQSKRQYNLTQINQNSKKKENIKVDMQKVCDKKKELQNEMRQIQAVILKFQVMVNGVESKIQTFQSQNKGLQGTNQSNLKKIQRFQREISDIQDIIKNKQGKKKQLRIKISQQEMQIEEYKKKHKEMQQLIENVRQISSQYKETSSELQREKEQFENIHKEKQSLQRDLNEKKKQFELNVSQIQEQMDVLKLLKQEIAQQSKTLEQSDLKKQQITQHLCPKTNFYYSKNQEQSVVQERSKEGKGIKTAYVKLNSTQSTFVNIQAEKANINRKHQKQEEIISNLPKQIALPCSRHQSHNCQSCLQPQSLNKSKSKSKSKSNSKGKSSGKRNP